MAGEPYPPGVLQESVSGTAAEQHWLRVGVRRRAGVCVPLFSLRSRRDCGIGDVADLFLLADWCREVGLEVIQFLPLNDMGLDSVPYAALSAFALDPVYLALDLVDVIRDSSGLRGRYEELVRELGQAPRVDWRTVRREKTALLEEAFRAASGKGLERELEEFRAGSPWLDDYLPYRVIKEVEGFRSWEEWGARYADRRSVERLLEEHRERVRFHAWLQMLLGRQLARVREHAAKRGILLKGDIPILVSRDSADVWRHPEYFRLDTVAGAPPDMYARDGQCWGFPTYDWDRLAQDDYGWWRARLRQAQRYFDLYRIDHVVGFFRIWTIRHGEKTGRDGRFVPEDEAVWGDHGERLLKMMLDSSTMLPLAEDLGTIPHVCRRKLAELGICGLKVQRWEKRWEEDRSFIQPAEYPPLSVATVSTHDSEILSHWWRNEPQERQQLWETLGFPGAAPGRLPPDAHRRILSWVASGGSSFSIFLLQELLGSAGLLPGDPADHRINVPGTVSDRNWTWRCPVLLEDMAGSAGLMTVPGTARRTSTSASASTASSRAPDDGGAGADVAQPSHPWPAGGVTVSGAASSARKSSPSETSAGAVSDSSGVSGPMSGTSRTSRFSTMSGTSRTSWFSTMSACSGMSAAHSPSGVHE